MTNDAASIQLKNVKKKKIKLKFLLEICVAPFGTHLSRVTHYNVQEKIMRQIFLLRFVREILKSEIKDFYSKSSRGEQCHKNCCKNK